MSGRIDFERINAAALAVLPVALSRFLPNGRAIGHEFVALKVEGTWKIPDATWPYRDGEERLLGYACRWDLPPECDGEKPDKEFSFAAWCRNRKGECRWKLKHLPAPRPLYGLDRLAERSDVSVIVCEGEKACDAAARIFPNSVAITSPGGSGAEAQADWTPLSGRKVVIWPDHDEVGKKYAAEVARILHGFESEVSVIDAAALASLSPDGGKREPIPKWDAADAVGEWSDLEALREAAALLAKLFDPALAFVSWGAFTMKASGLTQETTKGRGDNAESDPTFAIPWPFQPEVISERDQMLPASADYFSKLHAGAPVRVWRP